MIFFTKSVDGARYCDLSGVLIMWEVGVGVAVGGDSGSEWRCT